nr:hypothetical protein GCM10020093_058910 [Planobispora longispora]
MTFDVGAFMLQSVPFARALDISFDKVEPGFAVCRMPDRADLHNHLGGPHAGALFTLAESASGAAMLSAFGDQLAGDPAGGERGDPLREARDGRGRRRGPPPGVARGGRGHTGRGGAPSSTSPSRSRPPTAPWSPR